MSHLRILSVRKLTLDALLLLVTLSAIGAELQQAWISPSSVPGNFTPEDFSAERYVWSNISTGAGTRRYGPMLHIDSKGSIWILGGYPDISNRDTHLNAMWNYNPVTDLYRWVAGYPILDESGINLGQMGIPSDDVFPGVVDFSANAIDYNDNIWIYGSKSEPANGNRLWRFNTTSLQFTWIGGDSTNSNPIYGQLGEASPEFWPGYKEGACMVVDSQNNLWMLGGSFSTLAHNAVWHYNLTSSMWSLQYGTPEGNLNQDPDFENNIWPGRRAAGCTIDEDDRIWIFGGYARTTPYDTWNDMWSFDTKTVTWRVELGFNSSFHAGNVVSFDTFHAENFPAGRDRVGMVDRRDGTIMMFGGNADLQGSFHDIWVFNKTSKLWKIVYGSGNNDTIVKSSFGPYREIGSKLGSRQGYGIEQGLTSGGDLVIFGGEDYDTLIFNDIWIIPRDLCQVGTHDCDPNASCTTGVWSYTCTCNEGYVGDGKTCSVAPSAPVVPAPGVPSASPKSNTSAATVISISITTCVTTLLAIAL